MDTTILTGAAMVATAVPVAWWAVASGRSAAGTAAALHRGFGPAAPSTDLRAAELQQPASDRAIAPAIAALARQARRVTPIGMVESLERRLGSAGLHGKVTLEQVLAGKVTLGSLGAVIALTRLLDGITIVNLVLALFFVGLGWFAPDAFLHSKTDERRKKVQRELADTMDQITIAVEAGLGFEAAMARTAATGKGVLGEEIARTLQDIQLGVARGEALEAMAARCDLAELRHFVSAIRQAEKYGLPIASVLRVQAAELRDKRRQRAEEHAMKIPVKVLFPLVFCILPTLFIVILGPGAIRIMDGWGGS